MLLKGRSESDELTALRYLNTRMDFPEKERLHYLNLEKGYEGEMKFDLLAEGLQEERYNLNDLLLEVNNSYFQIDTLIISQGSVHLLDIKNFEGDCYLESEKLYAVKTGREFKNPVNQLNRSGTLFRQLLKNLKLNFLVEASIIFMNPEFSLFQAPMDQPIILPTQIHRFLKDLNKTPSKLNADHTKLAQTLISLHHTKNPHTVLPQFHYDQLQKGVYCKACHSFQMNVQNHEFVCEKCGEHEKVEQAILRNIEEFKFLFPDRKLTTREIHEWCRVSLHRRTLCRILKKNYTAFGNTSDTYYL